MGNNLNIFLLYGKEFFEKQGKHCATNWMRTFVFWAAGIMFVLFPMISFLNLKFIKIQYIVSFGIRENEKSLRVQCAVKVCYTSSKLTNVILCVHCQPIGLLLSQISRFFERKRILSDVCLFFFMMFNWSLVPLLQQRGCLKRKKLDEWKWKMLTALTKTKTWKLLTIIIIPLLYVNASGKIGTSFPSASPSSACPTPSYPGQRKSCIDFDLVATLSCFGVSESQA